MENRGILQAAAFTDLSRKGQRSAFTGFALRSAEGSWRAASGGSLPSRAHNVSRSLSLHVWSNVSPVQARRICSGLITRVRTPTTSKTPWLRGGKRCFVQASLGGAFQSIENWLHYGMCHAVSRFHYGMCHAGLRGRGFFELLIAAKAPMHRTPLKVRKLTFPHGILV